MLYSEYSQKFLQKKLKLNYQNKKIKKKDILSKLNDKIVKSLDFISYLEFLLEKSDEDTRKFVSELINDIEDISVEIISGIENIPIVGNIAQSTIEGIKAFANAVADPKKYKEINNVKDFVEDSFNFIEGIGDGIQTTTVETIKDIGHEIKDTLRPLTGDNVVLEGIEKGFNEVANKANDCFNFFGNIFNDIRNAFVR